MLYVCVRNMLFHPQIYTTEYHNYNKALFCKISDTLNTWKYIYTFKYHMSTRNLITLPADIKKIDRDMEEIYILTNGKPISLEDS